MDINEFKSQPTDNNYEGYSKKEKERRKNLFTSR